jgi:hypothetical protein
MNQADDVRRMEARQKRWKYLWNRLSLYLRMAMLPSMIVWCLWRLHYLRPLWSEMWVYALTLLLMGGMAWICWRGGNRLMRQVHYVPPVAEQLDARCVEKSLVRGADEPAAPVNELLRAANAGIVTGQTELLRSPIDDQQEVTQ